MSNLHIYLFTSLLLGYSIFYIIPAVTYELDDFHKTEKYYDSSEIFEKESLIRENKLKLVLTMSDDTKWYVRRTHLAYFPLLNSPANVGKKFTFYTINKSDDVPLRIEIEDKIIFDFESNKEVYYLLLGVTFIFVLISGKKLLGK